MYQFISPASGNAPLQLAQAPDRKQFSKCSFNIHHGFPLSAGIRQDYNGANA